MIKLIKLMTYLQGGTSGAGDAELYFLRKISNIINKRRSMNPHILQLLQRQCFDAVH